MSLEELAKDYRAAAAPIRLRLRQLRQAKKQTQDREELFWIARRTAVLTTMLHELNELSELLEHFQWLNPEDVRALMRGEDPDRLNAIAEEFADVMMYGLQLTRTLNIDITEQILRKIDIVDRRPAKPGEKKR